MVVEGMIKISSSECSAQGQVLHCKRRNLGCSSAGGRSSTANSGPKAAVLPGIEKVRQLPVPHSLASEQTLKGPRGTNVEVRRVDLANWALRTSPKFTTGVKYQFYQGFWPNQRSGNCNHPSPPIKIYYYWNMYVRADGIHSIALVRNYEATIKSPFLYSFVIFSTLLNFNASPGK